MSKSLRYGSALSALALAGVISGCAAPRSALRSASSQNKALDSSNVGLATRALVALNAQDYASAVQFAERAVEKSAADAGFRALLGNAYFGSGRFASAEAAYRDSLALSSNQPQVVLKLVLVQIAQGKSGEAIAFLQAARTVLDPSDYGLALALAGQPAEAAAVLDAAARQPGADARVRQNLALSHAFMGDWTTARTIAAQDIAPDQLDARIEQWMVMAKPAQASDQVAALTGIKPAASDPGQPVRLALRGTPVKLAQVAPAPVPVAVAAAEPALPPMPAAPPPVAEMAASLEPVAVPVLAFDAPAPAELAAEAAPPPLPPVRKPVRAAAFVPKRVPLHAASWSKPGGNSTAVVQLGAYGSPQRVAAAWNAAARRYSALRNFSPMSARFASTNGTVYRLSVKGFAGAKDAAALCGALRRSGGSCFVRTVAGDAPVRIASR